MVSPSPLCIFFFLFLSTFSNLSTSSTTQEYLKLPLLHRSTSSLDTRRLSHPRRTSLKSPLMSGAPSGSGQYFVSLRLGTPPQTLLLVADTGSDLTWVECSACSSNCSAHLPGSAFLARHYRLSFTDQRKQREEERGAVLTLIEVRGGNTSLKLRQSPPRLYQSRHHQIKTNRLPLELAAVATFARTVPSPISASLNRRPQSDPTLDPAEISRLKSWFREMKSEPTRDRAPAIWAVYICVAFSVISVYTTKRFGGGFIIS